MLGGFLSFMRKKHRPKTPNPMSGIRNSFSGASGLMQNDRADQAIERFAQKYAGTTESDCYGNTWVDPKTNEVVGYSRKAMKGDQTLSAWSKDPSVEAYERQELEARGTNRVRYQMIRENRGV